MHTYNETCDSCTLLGIDNGAWPAGQCPDSVCFECEGMCKAVRPAVVPFYCWSCQFVMGMTEQEAKAFHDKTKYEPTPKPEESDKAARDARTGAELQRDTSLFPGMVKEDKDSLIKTASRFSDTIVPAGKPIDASLFDPNRWGNNERGFDKSPSVDFDVRAEIENKVNSSLARSAEKEAFAAVERLGMWPVQPSPLTPQEAFVAAGTELLEALDKFHGALSLVLKEPSAPSNLGDIGHTEA